MCLRRGPPGTGRAIAPLRALGTGQRGRTSEQSRTWPEEGVCEGGGDRGDGGEGQGPGRGIPR